MRQTSKSYRTRAFASGVLALLLLLAGCAGSANQGQVQPKPPTARPASTRTAEAATRAAMPTKIPTPNLPMATPYATPRPQAGHYENAEVGLSFEYPFSWNRSSRDDVNALVQIANQADDVFVFVVRTPLPSDQDVAATIEDMLNGIAAWLGEFEPAGTRDLTLASGETARVSEHRGYYHFYYDSPAQMLLASVAHGKQLITFVAHGIDAAFTPERQTVEQVFASVKLSEARIYGVPRSEALVYIGSEAAAPRAYDPATGSGDRRVFSGLVSLNPQLEVVPELAESWDISPDGTVYTFYLRPNARFHSGRPVTAQDVIYSWERAADPATKSDTVESYLGDIVGVVEKRNGKAQEISGLKALDEHTLQVTIDAPKPYFLMKLTYSLAVVLDRANVETGAQWYRRPNGTGPYRMIRWEPGKVRMYERNEQFYLEPASIRYIVERFDAWNPFQLYQMDELDQVYLDGRYVGYVRDPEYGLQAELHEARPMCTSFVSFDTSKAPFDDPKVRQAFALAIDRERYAERALSGGSLLARGLYPPALPGYNPAFQGIGFDPAQARQRLAESRYGGAEKLPPVVLTIHGYGLYVDPGVGILAQMWQETLGATVQIEKLEPVGYSDTIQSGAGGNLFFWGWCADYPDPENIADALFHSGAQQNIGHYSNPDLDGLLDQARTERDVAQRITLYQQAEQMIVEDAAAIFLDHELSFALVKPRVKGYAMTPMSVPLERYLSFEPGT